MFRKEAVCDKLFKSCETISIDHVYISTVTVQGFSYLYQIGPLNSVNRPAHDITVKTCLKRPLKNRPQIGFQDGLSLNINAGQGYCKRAFCNTFDLH